MGRSDNVGAIVHRDPELLNPDAHRDKQLRDESRLPLHIKTRLRRVHVASHRERSRRGKFLQWNVVATRRLYVPTPHSPTGRTSLSLTQEKFCASLTVYE